jgi:hypothetical protein
MVDHYEQVMKLPTIAAILLVLAAPAFAASKKDMKDIQAWEHMHGICAYGLPAKHPDWDKICAAADVLGKKLVARGYCIVGHGAVGRAGRPWTQKEWKRMGFPDTPHGKHCYLL